jgi:hypothetical protein
MRSFATSLTKNVKKIEKIKEDTIKLTNLKNDKYFVKTLEKL